MKQSSSGCFFIIDSAVEAAEKRGREEGLGKGKPEAARKMLAAGSDARAAADALGISVSLLSTKMRRKQMTPTSLS